MNKRKLLQTLASAFSIMLAIVYIKTNTYGLLIILSVLQALALTFDLMSNKNTIYGSKSVAIFAFASFILALFCSVADAYLHQYIAVLRNELMVGLSLVIYLLTDTEE